MSIYRKTQTARSIASREQALDECSPVLHARNFAFLSLFFMTLSLGAYVFSVNRNAVSGYSMRIAEKRFADLSEESQKLKIREAELRSLYGLEDASTELGMIPISDKISLDNSNPVAYRR